MPDPVNKNRIFEYLDSYIEKYPRSELRDIYKILYQAFHGAEHYAQDRAESRNWLNMEWDSIDILNQQPKQELYESIFIEKFTPVLYRLNLAPTKRLGIDREIILDEFNRTASEFPRFFPSSDRNLHEVFVKGWKEIEPWISTGNFGFDSQAYGELTAFIESMNWPALQHSETYRLAYNPHYRLVMNPDLTDR